MPPKNPDIPPPEPTQFQTELIGHMATTNEKLEQQERLSRNTNDKVIEIGELLPILITTKQCDEKHEKLAKILHRRIDKNCGKRPFMPESLTEWGKLAISVIGIVTFLALGLNWYYNERAAQAKQTKAVDKLQKQAENSEGLE